LAEAFAVICSDKKVIAELEQFTAGVLARIGTESPG